MSETQTKKRLSPNEELTGIVVEALKAQGLLSEQYEADALRKIRSGKASTSDWRIWAEQVVMDKEKNDGASGED